ncbi:hypothetical protein [Nocardioides sp.]|uniref:hypothetical protein n=1 Tax=Nocardioides sp. TaxID=35761 RepID=UPI0025CB8299|nr:hypothetical protein [Nocardioides sp.]
MAERVAAAVVVGHAVERQEEEAGPLVLGQPGEALGVDLLESARQGELGSDRGG